MRSHEPGSGKPLTAIKCLLLLALSLAAFLVACEAPLPAPTQTPTPTTTPTATAPLALSELKYRLFSRFSDVFWCDPDFYPIGRPGQEEKNALEQYPVIRANSEEFTAILKHLSLSNKDDHTGEEKLNIYREHKKLTRAVELTVSGNIYSFTLRVGEGQGYRIEGTITPSGEIKETKRETSINTCPICLAKGTLIATPAGAVPVEQLRQGMTVWTLNEAGERAVGVVVRTAAIPVPPDFRMTRITLSDSRSVTASPGHPTAEQRTLGEYLPGQILDGAPVTGIERIPYAEGATYDLLPSGGTGLYWANGILMKSTLANK